MADQRGFDEMTVPELERARRQWQVILIVTSVAYIGVVGLALVTTSVAVGVVVLIVGIVGLALTRRAVIGRVDARIAALRGL